MVGDSWKYFIGPQENETDGLTKKRLVIHMHSGRHSQIIVSTLML